MNKTTTLILSSLLIGSSAIAATPVFVENEKTKTASESIFAPSKHDFTVDLGLGNRVSIAGTYHINNVFGVKAGVQHSISTIKMLDNINKASNLSKHLVDHKPQTTFLAGVVAQSPEKIANSITPYVGVAVGYNLYGKKDSATTTTAKTTQTENAEEGSTTVETQTVETAAEGTTAVTSSSTVTVKNTSTDDNAKSKVPTIEPILEAGAMYSINDATSAKLSCTYGISSKIKTVNLGVAFHI